MPYRIAKALDTLRTQVNKAYPNRSKLSDGWIGDQSHQTRQSDHNPNAAGVVQGLDITHDPTHGFDSYKFAEYLRTKRDSRIKYVISNGRIFSATNTPWTWRNYSGSNKHDKHVHVSVGDSPSVYDDPKEWDIGIGDTPVEPPKPVDRSWLIPGVKKIIDWEAKKDKNGNLQVYRPGDGSYEVAGISSNAHKATVDAIIALLGEGKNSEAVLEVAKFIIDFTNPAEKWHEDNGVEFFCRDCIYNRGLRGAALILQRAVGTDCDGIVGQHTHDAAAAIPAKELLTKLRTARESYEIATYGKRTQYWTGLTNRWNNALTLAIAFSNDTTPHPIVRDTKWLQSALNRLGANPPLEVDGEHGIKTAIMVGIFQKENGLKITGLADSATLDEVEKHLRAAEAA